MDIYNNMKVFMTVMFLVMSVRNVFPLDIYLSTDKVNSTDASGDIQNALNKISKDKGGTLYLGKGTYNVSSNLVMFSNTRIIGDGMDTTKIRLNNYALPFVKNGSRKAGLIRGTFQNSYGCDNIVIANLTLDGNKENQYHDEESKYGRFGVFTEACVNVTFDGLKIHSMQGYGFYPHGAKPSDYAYNLRIINSVSYNNDWDGFTLDQTIGVYVKNCTAYSNGRHGFNVVTGTNQAIITNVTAYDNGYYYYKTDPGCGIAMQDNMQFGTTNLTIFNALLSGDNKSGFCTVGNVTNLQMSNMTIRTSDRCIHLASGVVNALIYNINCYNASKFMVSYSPVNLIAFNNTMNGTSIKPIPTPSPTPKSPKSPTP